MQLRRSRHRATARSLVIALACAVSSPLLAAAMTESATPAAALVQAADLQRADYRQAHSCAWRPSRTVTA